MAAEPDKRRTSGGPLKASLSDWLSAQEASGLGPGALDWTASAGNDLRGTNPGLQPALPVLNTSLSNSFTSALPGPFSGEMSMMLKNSSTALATSGLPSLSLSGMGLPASASGLPATALSATTNAASIGVSSNGSGPHMPRLAAPPVPSTSAPSGATLRLVSQPESGAWLVKRTPAEYILELTGAGALKSAAAVKAAAEVYFWIDNVQRWEQRDDAGEVTVTKKLESNADQLVRLTWTARYSKTSKMLPVYIRFNVSAPPALTTPLSLDSHKIILIGREDLQKTRAEGVVFWMRVAGGIENELFKGKYAWSSVELLLKEHFARRMGGEGRMFDSRELAYIQERAKLAPSNPILIGREAFLQTFWPWLYPVMENIVRYKDLWNAGLLHGFFQTAEAEQLIKDCAPGTFLLRFCSNSAFEPQGALAVSVATKAGVQHILLTAEALEKDPLPRLLARHTDCMQFYPNTPKGSLEAIRKEMDDLPSVAHYRDAATFATCAPAAAAANPSSLPVPLGAAAAAAAANAPARAPKRRLADLDDVAVPTQIIVRPADAAEKEARFHLSEGLTFGALLGTALKHLKNDDRTQQWTFTDREGVAYPDDAEVASAFRGLRNPPTIFLGKLK